MVYLYCFYPHRSDVFGPAPCLIPFQIKDGRSVVIGSTRCRGPMSTEANKRPSGWLNNRVRRCHAWRRLEKWQRSLPQTSKVHCWSLESYRLYRTDLLSRGHIGYIYLYSILPWHYTIKDHVLRLCVYFLPAPKAIALMVIVVV